MEKINNNNQDLYYSLSDLKKMRITQSLIKKFLPNHDGEKQFNQYGKTMVVKYYNK